MIARFAIPFFVIVGFVIMPLLLFLLCRKLLPNKRYGTVVGILLAALEITLVAYGMTGGLQTLEVQHVEYASADLPEAFDGYRIVQFSDAHVGTMTGSRQYMVQELIDSINAQNPDMIVFTGDMQNIYPEEMIPPMLYFRQLVALDGVYAVLGNHDYAVYQTGTDEEKETNSKLTKDVIRKMGFDLLLNEHRIIRRDSDSIVLAGMENWGLAKRMPRKGDVQKTLNSPSSIIHHPSDFVIMLQHDPSCWREKILPECHAQLTLSGHTHGGQFSIFGWSPAALSYNEWQGMSYEGSRALFVSTGAGSLIPFRLNQPREIVVITLRKK
jgi:hypothetical protein